MSEPREENDDGNFVRLSERLGRLPPYMFGEINALKLKMRRDQIDVIDMAMGNPADPTPDLIVDKLCEVVRDPRNHRYSTAGGIDNLRREVAKYYSAMWDVDLEPNEVIATIGSKEGFSHLCLALLGPGDMALTPAPAFPIHVNAVVLAGASYISIPVTDDETFLRRVSETCCTTQPRPKVLFINYPHNPSGHTVDPEFYVEIVRIAKKHELIVVSDFAYGQMCFDEYRAPSFLATPGAKDVGVEFITMSKAFNMAGWRIGFCAGNRSIINGLAAIKGYYDYGIFQAIQIASIIGLRHCADFALEQAAKYQSRRDALLTAMDRIGWTGVEKPRAGMFVWAGLPEEFRHLGSIEFSNRLMKEAAVAMSPGLGFGPEGEGFVRLALIENEQRLQQAVRNMKRAFQKWPDAKPHAAGDSSSPESESVRT